MQREILSNQRPLGYETEYLNLVSHILERGDFHRNRTGVRTRRIHGAALRAENVIRQFPILTTRKMPLKSITAEIIGFLNGYTNASDFEELGCNWWRANADENQAWLDNPNRIGPGDLGRIYGAQWTDFNGVNQVQQVIDQIRTGEDNRRMIINAWNPAELDKMALPPCHVMYQFYLDKEGLSVSLYQRSCDLMLGVPNNIMGASILLIIIALVTGNTPKHVAWYGHDVHIYDNHEADARTLIDRERRTPPSIAIVPSAPNRDLSVYTNWRPEDFRLLDYRPGPAMKMPMAV